MEYLWAPWRIAYIEMKKPEGCFFCTGMAVKDDEKNLILYRGKKTFIILNSFPYNNGHLMVAPYEHAGDLHSLDNETKLEMMQLSDFAIEVLKEAVHPDGFNLGVNMGTVAGAGVADHIHLHVVPRWNGDTNFMPVLVDTKVLPQALCDTYKLLKKVVDKMTQNGKLK